jgi:hypothetical protein
MSVILDVIFEILAEIVLQIVGEALFEVGWESARSGTRRMPAVFAALGLAVLGGAAGAMSGWLVPHRLMSWTIAPVLSLLVAPVLVGGFLHWFGIWRRRRGHATSHLATFYGGASFAFGSAVARYLMLA